MRIQAYFEQTSVYKIQKLEILTNKDGENYMRVKYFDDRRWHTIKTFTHTKTLKIVAQRIDRED